MLSSGIDMSVEEMRERVDRRKREPKFRPIVLKEDVSVADIAFVKAHRLRTCRKSASKINRDGVILAANWRHTRLVMSVKSPKPNSNPEFVDFKSGDQVGQAGLEREYNHVLRGKDGFKRVIVNSMGREMGQLEDEATCRGQRSAYHDRP